LAQSAPAPDQSAAGAAPIDAPGSADPTPNPTAPKSLGAACSTLFTSLLEQALSDIESDTEIEKLKLQPLLSLSGLEYLDGDSDLQVENALKTCRRCMTYAGGKVTISTLFDTPEADVAFGTEPEPQPDSEPEAPCVVSAAVATNTEPTTHIDDGLSVQDACILTALKRLMMEGNAHSESRREEVASWLSQMEHGDLLALKEVQCREVQLQEKVRDALEKACSSSIGSPARSELAPSAEPELEAPTCVICFDDVLHDGRQRSTMMMACEHSQCLRSSLLPLARYTDKYCCCSYIDIDFLHFW